MEQHEENRGRADFPAVEALEEQFSVCRVKDYTGIDVEQPFVFTGCTDAEKSLVCPTDRVPAEPVRREDGWRAMRICGELDFSLIGILARISRVLAESGIGIFAVSTYDTDYILTKAENFEKALSALAHSGCRILRKGAAEEDRKGEKR